MFNRLTSYALAIVLLNVLPISATAQEAPPDSTLGPRNPAEVEAFFDGLMAANMEEHDIAGATLAVVRGDSVLLAKGYGHADAAEEQPVQADRTLFRVGSISKLFVWTAVMQLVEEGRLDLEADVNTYLTDFQIPDTYDEPITLEHLMTHTAGFEDRVIGLFGRDSTSLRPHGEILAEQLPARVRPPGEVAAYSNHGAAIAAYIVEQVSGQSWDAYVEEHILEPLGMEHTTFRQPLPSSLAADRSKGFSYSDGQFHEEPFEYIPLAPLGAASSTATDMARFMRAFLHDGRLDEAAILDSTTARRMREPLFRHAKGVNPMAHGFIDESRNNQRVVGHGGATSWFHSRLVLLPEHDVGLFYSYNSEGGGAANGPTYRAFTDQFFPANDLATAEPDSTDRERLRRFAGTYQSDRHAHTTLAKLGATFSAFEVTAQANGTLKMNTSDPTRWVPTGPLTFRSEDGRRTIAFREDQAGRITYLFVGSAPYVAYERVAWFGKPGLHGWLLGSAALIFLLTVVGGPAAAFMRWRHGVKRDPDERLPRAARVLAWLASLLLLVFITGLFFLLTTSSGLVYGVSPFIKGLLVLPLVALVLVAGVVFYAGRVWWTGRGRLGGRLLYTLLAMAFLVTLWQLYYWNLLGFQY